MQLHAHQGCVYARNHDTPDNHTRGKKKLCKIFLGVEGELPCSHKIHVTVTLFKPHVHRVHQLHPAPQKARQAAQLLPNQTPAKRPHASANQRVQPVKASANLQAPLLAPLAGVEHPARLRGGELNELEIFGVAHAARQVVLTQKLGQYVNKAVEFFNAETGKELK